MALTKEQILNCVDIQIKEIPVEEWGDTIYIKQLSRAQQDDYLKRQFGATRMRQDGRAKSQEISAVNIHGHDTFLCACGICDEDGNPLFKMSNIDALKKKNGAVIGSIAVEIIKFSKMEDDDAEALAAELEHYREKFPDDAKAYKEEHPPGLEGEVKN